MLHSDTMVQQDLEENQMTVLPAPKASAATKMQFACSLLAGQIYRRHEQMDDDHIAKEINPGGDETKQFRHRHCRPTSSCQLSAKPSKDDPI